MHFSRSCLSDIKVRSVITVSYRLLLLLVRRKREGGREWREREYVWYSSEMRTEKDAEKNNRKHNRNHKEGYKQIWRLFWSWSRRRTFDASYMCSLRFCCWISLSLFLTEWYSGCCPAPDKRQALWVIVTRAQEFDPDRDVARNRPQVFLFELRVWM